jgi:hypothetical protein
VARWTERAAEGGSTRAAKRTGAKGSGRESKGRRLKNHSGCGDDFAIHMDAVQSTCGSRRYRHGCNACTDVMVKDTGSGGQGVRVWGVGQSRTIVGWVTSGGNSQGQGENPTPSTMHLDMGGCYPRAGEKQVEKKGKQAKGLLGEVKIGMMKRQTHFFGNTGVIIKHRVELGLAWQEVGPGLERGAFAAHWVESLGGGVSSQKACHGGTVDRKSSGGWVDPCRKAHRRQRQW